MRAIFELGFLRGREGNVTKVMKDISSFQRWLIQNTDDSGGATLSSEDVERLHDRIDDAYAELGEARIYYDTVIHHVSKENNPSQAEADAPATGGAGESGASPTSNPTQVA